MLQIRRFRQEVGQVGQADPRQLELFQVDEWHGVAIEERHILSIYVENIVGRLLNVQRLQVGAGVDQPGENEVVGGNQLQSVDVLTHVRDIRGLLRQRHVELAGDAVGQGHLFGLWEHVAQVRGHLVDGHLHLVLVLHRHRFHAGQRHLLQVECFAVVGLHHGVAIAAVVNFVENSRAESKIFET